MGDRKPVKETRKIKPKCKDSPDIETGSTIDSPSLLLNALDSPAVYIGDASEMISPMELNDSANTTNGSIDGGGGAAPVAVENVEIDVERVHVRTEVTETKTDGPSPCIVCQKIFKSRSCLNKHLRNVHTGTSAFSTFFFITFFLFSRFIEMFSFFSHIFQFLSVCFICARQFHSVSSICARLQYEC